MAPQLKSIAGIAALVLSFLSLTQASNRVCAYSRSFNRYICFNQNIYNPITYTRPTCTNYQRSMYQAYSGCCGNNIYITNGACCVYSYQNVLWNSVSSVCMCSIGTKCSTINPVVNPVVTVTTPKPTTTTPKPTTTTQKPTTTTPKPTTTTPKPTTTTPKPTTTTPKPTTTTPKPTTTTPKPTTTTPKPTTTTTKPTTTSPKPTTTTPTTTTPYTKKYCSSYRLLNSEAANECDYPGITAITTSTEARDDVYSCNAVFVAAHINGTTKPAFFTSNLCREQLQKLAIQGGLPYNFKIGGKEYPIDIGSMFNVVNDPSKGSSFFVMKDRFLSLINFNGNCQRPACVFTKDMVGQVNYGDCEIVGYGASSSDLTYSGLRKVKVHLTNNDLCSDKTQFFDEVDTMCFRTVSGENLFCSNDMGSAVFCKTYKSGEKIMIGAAAFQKTCDTSPTFKIIPYPATEINPA